MNIQEVELALLGAIVLDNAKLYEVQNIVKPEMFYVKQNQAIYEAMLSLQKRGIVIDLLSLCEETERLGLGVSRDYIVELVNTAITPSNTVYYAELVCDSYLARELRKAGQKIIQISSDQSKTVSDRIAEAQNELFKLNLVKRRDEVLSVAEVLDATIADVENRIQNPGKTGIPTGFSKLDEATGGFQPGDLIILAARPAMGKTSLALNMAQAAAENGAKVLFFSTEMTKEQLGQRLLAGASGISTEKMRNGNLDYDTSFPRLIEAGAKLFELPLYIVDAPKLTTGEIATISFQQKMTTGLDMIVVDYLQRLADKLKNRQRYEEVGEMAVNLKTLAKQLHVPVLALAQLGRSVEARQDKIPRNSDLRESGNLEAEADVILLLYRAEVYDPKPENMNKADLIVSKHRQGPEVWIKLIFEKAFTKFREE
jgi:replicative DNA helicase